MAFPTPDLVSDILIDPYTDGVTKNLSLTISNANSTLVVAFAGPSADISSIKWNTSESLSLVAAASGTCSQFAAMTNNAVAFFVLQSPSTGTHNLTFFSTSTGNFQVQATAYVFSGTDNSTVAGATVSVTATSGALTLALPPGGVIIDCVNVDNQYATVGTSLTAGGSQTARSAYSNGASANRTSQNSSYKTSAANTSWSWPGSAVNAIIGGLSLKAPATGPTINTQPTNQTAKIGATATFTAAATSSGTGLAAQWQKNATNISGATNPTTYTTPTVALGDNGATFDCVYTDSNGSVTTSTATLTVAPDTAAGPFFYQLLGSNHV